MTDRDVLLRLEPIREALAELRDADAITRLHHRDPSLWSSSPQVQQAISDRLGWLDVVGGTATWGGELRAFSEAVRADGLHRLLLMGMGGSSLAPELFAAVFEGRTSGAQLSVLDSTHPDAVRAVLDDSDLSDTLVMVSSKSGTTEETRAFAAHAATLVDGPHQLVAVTDPGSQLHQQAREEGWRAVFTNPADIGGRYSALSLFGMLPAAVAGVDIDEVWTRGQAMADRCAPAVPIEDNPGVVLGAFIAGLARRGRDKLTLLLPDELSSLGEWIEQLVAESTGKQGVGIVPVVGEPLAAPERYGDDRAFVAYRLDRRGPDVDALTRADQPVLTLDCADRHDIGGAFVQWEVATALAGALLGVNPFDEPDVAEAKARTRAVLAEVAAGGGLPEPERDDPAALLAQLRGGDYLAVQAYLPPTFAYAEPLAALRTAVRDRWRVATTVGWGPRFLHSTGQLHKGGPDSLVALQLVDSPAGGPDIPGRDYDFATLLRAQAAGDLRALRDHGRRVAQYPVSSPADVQALVEQVRAGA